MTREDIVAGCVSLDKMTEHVPFHLTLKPEEKARMYPRTKVKCVMMSGDPPPPLQASMATIGFDVPDEARHGKISPTTPLSAKPSSPESDAEAIEEVVPIVKKTLPTPEPQPMIERNGFDVKTKKSLNEPEDESCIVNCIYFTQQCCECTIF